MERKCKVCVTGGAGYLGSSLVKKLLEKGYTVHSTLRNLDDKSKVTLLRDLPEANGRLELFEADIYKPNEYEPAIQGCEFVFHVATPMGHQSYSQIKEMSEAVIAGVKSIARCCVESGTVKRLIYTSSVVASSPLKEDGSGYKDFIDETCWTPLHLVSGRHKCTRISKESLFRNLLLKDTIGVLVQITSRFLKYPEGDSRYTLLHPIYHNWWGESNLKGYVESKTLADKELLSYGKNENGGGGLEVVSLACGLVGGDTLLNYMPLSLAALISQVKDNEANYQGLKFLEELDGKIPVVHIEDVCEAHIFCAENPSINGRFLVASSYASSADIANYYFDTYPEFHIKEKYLEGPERAIKWASNKLTDKGFVYKYGLKMILDDTVRCARRIGDL